MREMAALDLHFATVELRSLIGGIMQKVWQEGKIVRIEIFVPEKGTFELYFEPGRLYITEYRKQAAGPPEGWGSFARKHLTGEKISDVRQHGFDRIVEVETSEHIAIFELFSKGNVVLCDKDYKILLPLEPQLWKDRQVLPHKPYKYPPSVINPFKLDQIKLRTLLNEANKELVRFLAVDISFGGLYAEEIISRGQLNKSQLSGKLNDDELLALYESIHSLAKSFAPRIIFDDDKVIDAVPIELVVYKDKRNEQIPTFLHALDEYYTRGTAVELVTERATVLSGELGKIEHIAAKQKADLEKWKTTERESKQKAEAIYANFELVQKVMERVEAERKAGLSWEQIQAKLSAEFPQLKAIKSAEGKLVLDLP